MMGDSSAADATVQYVKLVSAEGLEFFLDREIARSHSGTLRKMLDSKFKEATDRIIMLPEMSGYILERVVCYLHHKQQYSNSTGQIPEFIIEPEAAMEILLAAKYLDC